MKILGIETSCDETAAALLEVTSNKSQVTKKIQISNPNIQTLSNVVLSQIEIHKKYGGIVPEVAARAHVESIIPVIEETLQGKKPDLIAVTKGPGLITSLQVGVQTAKTLSYIWNVPLIGVNHLEGHLWSFLLNKKLKEPRTPSASLRAGNKIKNLKIKNLELNENFKLKIENCLPAVALIVSGGHTELILVKGVGKYKLIGQTLDDAAGEAFDKVAKMLGLGYPGGPIISHFAKEGNSAKIEFPRPMLKSNDFDFSFSGLKTAVKYHLQKMLPTGGLSQAFLKDICASFQQAVIDVLVGKTIKAAEKFKAKAVILGGGVSANENLAQNLKLKASAFASRKLEAMADRQNLGIECYLPEKWLTGDNAAMIALVGYFHYQQASKSLWKSLSAAANLRLAS